MELQLEDARKIDVGEFERAYWRPGDGAAYGRRCSGRPPAIVTGAAVQ